MVTDVLWPPSFGETQKMQNFTALLFLQKKKKKEKILGPVQRMAYPLVQTLCPRFPTGVENIEVEGGGGGGGKGGGGTSVYTWGKHGGLKTVFLKSM